MYDLRRLIHIVFTITFGLQKHLYFSLSYRKWIVILVFSSLTHHGFRKCSFAQNDSLWILRRASRQNVLFLFGIFACVFFITFSCYEWKTDASALPFATLFSSGDLESVNTRPQPMPFWRIHRNLATLMLHFSQILAFTKQFCSNNINADKTYNFKTKTWSSVSAYLFQLIYWTKAYSNHACRLF